MEILAVAFGNVSLPVFALLFGLLLVASCLYVIQDAVRDTLRLRRFADAKRAEEIYDDDVAAVPPHDPRNLAYEEDSFLFMPEEAQPPAQGQSIVAYVFVIAILVVIVAVIVGIALSVTDSIGIETLIDGVRILSSFL